MTNVLPIVLSTSIIRSTPPSQIEVTLLQGLINVIFRGMANKRENSGRCCWWHVGILPGRFHGAAESVEELLMEWNISSSSTNKPYSLLFVMPCVSSYAVTLNRMFQDKFIWIRFYIEVYQLGYNSPLVYHLSTTYRSAIYIIFWNVH